MRKRRIAVLALSGAAVVTGLAAWLRTGTAKLAAEESERQERLLRERVTTELVAPWRAARVAIVSSTFIGPSAGVIPAMRAAQLEPITALGVGGRKRRAISTTYFVSARA